MTLRNFGRCALMLPVGFRLLQLRAISVNSSVYHQT